MAQLLVEGVEATASDATGLSWTGSLRGPLDTPYEGGTFRFKLEFGASNLPPVVTFQTPIWHQHVDAQAGGTVSVPMLGDASEVLHQLRAILVQPDAIQDGKAERWTQDYACDDEDDEEHGGQEEASWEQALKLETKREHRLAAVRAMRQEDAGAPLPQSVLTPAPAEQQAADSERYGCEFECGFRSTFAEASAHELVCGLRGRALAALHADLQAIRAAAAAGDGTGGVTGDFAFVLHVGEPEVPAVTVGAEEELLRLAEGGDLTEGPWTVAVVIDGGCARSASDRALLAIERARAGSGTDFEPGPLSFSCAQEYSAVLLQTGRRGPYAGPLTVVFESAAPTLDH